MAQATREAVPEIRKAATDIGGLARSANDVIPELRKTNAEIGNLARDSREAIPDIKKTNDQLQASLITWQRTGERAKLILDKNDDKITEAMDNLNLSLKRVGNALSDENQRNLSAALRNLRTGTENLPSISKNTDELLRESQKTMRRVNDSLAKTDEVMGNLQQATKPFAERSTSMAKNFDESTARLNAVLGDVQELLKAIDRGDGTIKKLINDPSLYNHLDEAACILMQPDAQAGADPARRERLHRQDRASSRVAGGARRHQPQQWPEGIADAPAAAGAGARPVGQALAPNGSRRAERNGWPVTQA